MPVREKFGHTLPALVGMQFAGPSGRRLTSTEYEPLHHRWVSSPPMCPLYGKVCRAKASQAMSATLIPWVLV